LWDGVKDGTDDYREDRNLLAALLRVVPKEMRARLAGKEFAIEAWEVIRVVCMGGERIKEANADKLHRHFSELQFKPGKCVEDFSVHVTAHANQLRDLSDKVMEKEEINKLLHSIPDHLKQVAIFIENLLDLNTMMIDEATSHLRVVEERKNKSTKGRLLLMKEKWMVVPQGP
jgi:hypothetical protein